ncbi:uncharacterized protein LOC114727650 [Neltuma alba]|uniref:uncharacterized protein LOC114727650 n=1 Tax=Neltuma alba TaxID=207710 RepID=UPI0010A44A0B|nr:uncharacterized protein LOC114727650 [Prosopis alba]
MGKTTRARAVYNAIADNFDCLSFLDDIQGKSGKHGLEQEQARMLSKVLVEKIQIEDINEGVELMKRILKDKKNLLILDNVDERKQLEMLAGCPNQQEVTECEYYISRFMFNIIEGGCTKNFEEYGAAPKLLGMDLIWVESLQEKELSVTPVSHH